MTLRLSFCCSAAAAAPIVGSGGRGVFYFLTIDTGTTGHDHICNIVSVYKLQYIQSAHNIGFDIDEDVVS